MKTRLVILMIVVALLTAVFTIPAVAAPPDKFIVPWNETGIYQGFDCGTPIYFTASGEIKFLEWWQDGLFMHGHQSFGTVRVVWYASEGGPELKVQAQGAIVGKRINENLVEIKSAGNNWVVIVPGYGMAGGDTGNLILQFDNEWNLLGVRMDTANFGFSEADKEAICAYLTED